jgi:hypothetical protein
VWTGTVALTFGAAVIMVTVHVARSWLVFLDRTPRSIWLSLAGGVSVAYVFVHLLPELARLQREHFAEHDIKAVLYLFAVAGLVAYCGLEQLAQRRNGTADADTGVLAPLRLLRLLQSLIGYLLNGAGQG